MMFDARDDEEGTCGTSLTARCSKPKTECPARIQTGGCWYLLDYCPLSEGVRTLGLGQ